MAETGRQAPAASRRPTRINIEVAYALPDEQVLLALEVEQGATVAQAIERSGILSRFPEVRVAPGSLGVFGRQVGLDEPLRDGDRVEIYRPLIANPKQARRERAKKPASSARR
jgi:putative ubiquitin-RnfH superfamily antitoxin RatB of RatAB toxin-antitoxin module